MRARAAEAQQSHGSFSPRCRTGRETERGKKHEVLRRRFSRRDGQRALASADRQQRPSASQSNGRNPAVAIQRVFLGGYPSEFSPVEDCLPSGGQAPQWSLPRRSPAESSQRIASRRIASQRIASQRRVPERSFPNRRLPRGDSAERTAQSQHGQSTEEARQRPTSRLAIHAEDQRKQ